MEQESTFLATQRFAIVTGANKGIGFEICRQLASKGIKVVLTARDEKKGLEAVEKLIRESGFSDHGIDQLVFHQLNVADPASIASVAEFIKTHFGKLDILINNAGIPGGVLDCVKAAELAGGDWPDPGKWNEILLQNYETAEECLRTNYYGAKAMVEALLPLLQLSDSPRVVSVSSTISLLKFMTNGWATEILSDVENLTEKRVDMVLDKFLKDFKESQLESRGWPTQLSAYKVSKAALNAYTRILAKKCPNICANCVCPGYVKTDMTGNGGKFTAAEGAECPVRLALLPDGKPSGHFFSRHQIVPF